MIVSRVVPVAVSFLLASSAYAQSTEPAAPAQGGDGSSSTTLAPVAPVAADDSDEVVLRNGFSLSAGQEFGTAASGAKISGQLFGIDWRIGARINRAISAYLHSHLSFGTASVGGASGATGNFATALVGEYLFPFRLFVAGGGGYGVLNNPNGPLATLRAGFYPFAHEGPGKARRFNIAFDARWYFVKDGPKDVTVTHLALSLGYDRF